MCAHSGRAFDFEAVLVVRIVRPTQIDALMVDSRSRQPCWSNRRIDWRHLARCGTGLTRELTKVTRPTAGTNLVAVLNARSDRVIGVASLISATEYDE